MKIITIILRTIAIGLFFFLAACAVPEKKITCTKEFVSISVNVEDTNGKPIKAQLSSRLSKINQEFVVKETATKGTYIVLDDSFKDKLSVTGDELELIAVIGRTISRANFIVAVDKDRCHVKKVSGPDKLVFPAL